MVITIRHWLYDLRILKSRSFDIPIVCIGNITVGGTGKTPTAEYILELLLSRYNIALLSRGYGRKTKGYREVSVNDSYLDVGDEPLQIKLKFPEVPVVVCADRVSAVERIRKEHPEVNLILMDDGFQHRSLTAKVNIIILDATRPFFQDNYLPYGRLRDTKSRLSAGHIFIVTKCPEDFKPIDRNTWVNKLKSIAYQTVYFTRICNLDIAPLFAFAERREVAENCEVILFSGIGNPMPFIRSASERFNVVAKCTFEDHHAYTAADLKSLYATLQAHPDAIILMTEKDAVKLRRMHNLPESMRRAMYFQPIVMEFLSDSDNFATDLIEEIEFKFKDLNDIKRPKAESASGHIK